MKCCSWQSVLKIGLLLALGLAGLAACGNNTRMEDKEAKESGSQVITLEGDAAFALVVTNAVGDVGVHAGDDGEVVVTYTKIAYANTEADAKSELADMRLVVAQEGTQVIVDGTQPGSVGGRSSRVDLSITVPAGMEVRITNAVGNITLGGLRPAAGLEVTNDVGEIEIGDVQAAGGPLVVNNKVGKVLVHNTTAAAGLRLITDTGQVEFDGALGTVGDYAITTQVGRIAVTLAGDPALRLDAATNTGTVSVQGFELGNQLKQSDDGGQALMGTLGDGAITLRLRAGVGNITLRRG